MRITLALRLALRNDDGLPHGEQAEAEALQQQRERRQTDDAQHEHDEFEHDPRHETTCVFVMELRELLAVAEHLAAEQCEKRMQEYRTRNAAIHIAKNSCTATEP